VEKWTTIRNLAREGYSKKAIAKMLKISRNMVRKALSSSEPPQYVHQVKGNTLIDPYRDQIEKMYLEKGLIGTCIYNELLKLGYTGSLTTLYRHLGTLKKEPQEKVTVRFETGPAVQAQFDWSPYKVPIAGREQLIYCFLLILSYSRYKYMTFSLDQRLNSVIEALEEGINFFGSVPLEILTGLENVFLECFPKAKTQRCVVHKLRNIATKLPRKLQKDCLDHIKRVFYANSYDEALNRFNDWKSHWDKVAPGAVHCLEKDLDFVLQFYHFPKHHWKIIRTTNIIERTFKEFRRRTRQMDSLPNEDCCLRCVYAISSNLNNCWANRKVDGFSPWRKENICIA
jgi:predicted transcriptional regulator